jgi:Ni/Co efflux regulator RcnB
MAIKRHLFLAVVLSICASQTVFARPHGDHDDMRHRDRGHHVERKGPKHGPHHGPRFDDRRFSGHPKMTMHRPAPRPHWRAGQVLPRAYRQPHFVVNDWSHRRLHTPPRGYHWVSVNGDYVLAAIATGVIMSVLFN